MHNWKIFLPNLEKRNILEHRKDEERGILLCKEENVISLPPLHFSTIAFPLHTDFWCSLRLKRLHTFKVTFTDFAAVPYLSHGQGIVSKWHLGLRSGYSKRAETNLRYTTVKIKNSRSSIIKHWLRILRTLNWGILRREVTDVTLRNTTVMSSIELIPKLAADSFAATPSKSKSSFQSRVLVRCEQSPR